MKIRRLALLLSSQSGRDDSVGLGLDEWHGREKMRFRDVGKLHSERERGLVPTFLPTTSCSPSAYGARPAEIPRRAAEISSRGSANAKGRAGARAHLHRRRMDEIGVEFGQIPVSDYGKRSLRCAARAILSLV